MTDKINEQLSAFVDGELPDAERQLLHKRLSTDDELQSTWQCYHLIRDALREDLPEFIRIPADTDYIEAADIPPAAVSNSGVLARRVAKPLAGLAIAASVAVLAVIGVIETRPVGQEAGPQVVDAATVLVPDSYRQVPRIGWESARPAVVSYLNGYLVDHSNYGGFGSAQGILPYSRVAGYDEPAPEGDSRENAKQPESEQ